MGFRSRMRGLATRLLESLVGSRRSPRAHRHSCRVCAAEQAISADDHTICASHLLTYFDSLKPEAALDASPTATTSFLSRASSTSTASTAPSTSSTSSASFSLPSRQATPAPFTTPQSCVSGAGACDFTCNGTATVSTEQQPPTHGHHAVECSSLVRSLTTALGPLRYAISGQLAILLQAARNPVAHAGTGDTVSEMLAISTVSAASWPSIVCPRSTRDVLPSWAAASRGHFTLSPDAVAVDAAWATSSLHINVDGTPTKVHIDWVDDEQFYCTPYVVEELATDCSSGSVPVLSVPSLMILAAGGPVESLLTNRACSGAQEHTIRRKPLPAGSLCKPLPPVPVSFVM